MKRTSVLGMFLVLALPHVYAQSSCDKLLSYGIYDTFQRASSSNNMEDFKTWYCNQNFKSSSDAKGFNSGAKIPIQGFPFSGFLDGNDTSFQASYASY